MSRPDTRYLVVSDFHLTSGKNPETGRWAATEDFFNDEAFASFLQHYENAGNCELIFNGDLCDFMQVLELPTKEQCERYGITAAEIDAVDGLKSSEAACAFQMDCIMNGHIAMFGSLARFLSKGNRLVILKGNHDIQLYWPGVQSRIRERMEEYCRSLGYELLDSQIEFPPWFYMIPGRLYVEHGNQFENTTAFRNFLYPMIPGQAVKDKPQLELDLSSFLVRYLTNKFEPVNPLADNIRPLSEYYETMWKKYPFFAVDTIGTALKYVLKAFGKARAFAKAKGKLKTEYEGIQAENKRRIAAQAWRYAGEGNAENVEQALYKLDEYWKREPDFTGRPIPTLEQGAWTFAWSIVWSVVKKAAWLIPIYVLTAIPNLGDWVNETVNKSGIPWLNSIVQFLHDVNVLEWLILFIAAVAVYFLRRLWLRRQKALRKDPKNYTDPVMPDVSAYMRKKARVIANLLDVRYVTFGHTHYADVEPLGNDRWYFNSGTWMGIFQPEENLYREVHQYSFLSVQGERAELLRWNADAKEPQSVVVIDSETPFTDVEDKMFAVLKDSLTKKVT